MSGRTRWEARSPCLREVCDEAASGLGQAAVGVAQPGVGVHGKLGQGQAARTDCSLRKHDGRVSVAGRSTKYSMCALLLALQVGL